MMTKVEWALVCLPGIVLLCVGATSGPVPHTDDYQSIITNRNVFGLKDPPPPPPPPAEVKPPPPAITLTGVTTILGEPLALFKCTLPANRGEPAKEKFYTLGINEREDEIEVKSINVEKGIVQVDDYGTVTNLSFEKNGATGSAVAASGPSGGFTGRWHQGPGLPRPTPLTPSSDGARTVPQHSFHFQRGGGSVTLPPPTPAAFHEATVP